MSAITSLKLRDVRCFAGEQTATFGRKVTVIVGENSTGKSTLLGCYKAFSALSGFVDLNDRTNYFDVAPFLMGGFETIARKGSAEFSVGGSFDGHDHTRVDFEFTKGGNGAPLESSIAIEFEDHESATAFTVSAHPTSPGIFQLRWRGLQLDIDGGEISYEQLSSWLANSVRRGMLPYGGDHPSFAKRKKGVTETEKATFPRLVNFLRTELPMPKVKPFAAEALTPESEPRQRFYKRPPLEVTRLVADYLGERGEKLSLFSGAQNKTDEAGTQVLIDRAGGLHNIMDVGYGIHSVLPVLMATYDKPAATTFLMQQPEVHLHPHAQALLAQLMAEDGHQFIVETHSDYIIDRLRICVMRGELVPEDVSIVYCEFCDDEEGASRIYNISIDEQGNLLGAPVGYREFFNQETNRLLGLSESGH